MLLNILQMYNKYFEEFLGLCDTVILNIEITTEKIILFHDLILYFKIYKLLPIANEIAYTLEYYEFDINKKLNLDLKKHVELIKSYLSTFEDAHLKLNISKLYDVSKYITLNNCKDSKLINIVDLININLSKKKL